MSLNESDFSSLHVIKAWSKAYSPHSLSLRPIYLAKLLKCEHIQNQSFTVVDMGCGSGELIPTILRHINATQYIGIDISEHLLSIASSRFPVDTCLFLNRSINSFLFSMSSCHSRDIPNMGSNRRLFLCIGVLPHMNISELNTHFSLISKTVRKGDILIYETAFRSRVPLRYKLWQALARSTNRKVPNSITLDCVISRLTAANTKIISVTSGPLVQAFKIKFLPVNILRDIKMLMIRSNSQSFVVAQVQ